MSYEKRTSRFLVPLTALLCAASLAPATANADEKSGISNEYSVTVPAELSISPNRIDADVSPGELDITEKELGSIAISGTLDAGNTLNVTASSRNDGYLHSSEGASLSYKLDGGDFTLRSDGSALTFKRTVTATLTQKATCAGTYTDTVTFTMDCSSNTSDSMLFFDSQGGDMGKVATSRVLSQGASYGELPKPTKAGYKFAGWFTAETNGVKVTESTEMGEESTTVYAHWTPNKLTINYHNGGADYIDWKSTSWPDGKQPVLGVDVSVFSTDYYGSKFSNGSNGLYDVWRWQKTGYAMQGSFWTSKDGIGEYNDKVDFKSAEGCAKYFGVLAEFAKGDVVIDLYPKKWVPITYTVEYNGNGADGGSMAKSLHTYDAKKTLTPNHFSKAGYKFVGWNTAQDGTGIEYADKQEVLNLTATSRATVTLYAQWEPISSDSNTDISSNENASNTSSIDETVDTSGRDTVDDEDESTGSYNATLSEKADLQKRKEDASESNV